MNPSSPKYSGKDAQLGKLDTYLGDVLCRCAERVQELGYQYFGIQNHGMWEIMMNVLDFYNKVLRSSDWLNRCGALSEYSKEIFLFLLRLFDEFTPNLTTLLIRQAQWKRDVCLQ